MASECDVLVIGGAFAGASTAILLLREKPSLRVVIVERSTAFDRKVGEATTEVSGGFLTKELGLAHHLAHHHITKQGLRFWFSPGPGAAFDECTELGPRLQVRMPSFQVDRAVLDEHLLGLASRAGATVLRPAKITDIECSDSGATAVVSAPEGGAQTLRARRVVDASGRSAVLARRMGLFRPTDSHPTRSVWARFRGVADLDGPELAAKYPGWARACRASRAAATNHLVGRGWWCWIIPLRGGDTSAGIVYDERLFSPAPADTPSATLLQHLLSHPVGRELFSRASPVEGDTKTLSRLPWFAESIAGPSWQLAGDAAGFLDPLYSAGLDYGSWTVTAAVRRVLADFDGRPADTAAINRRFRTSYDKWFRALYLDKYEYLGDAELLRAAYIMDIAWFYFGPVRELLLCPRGGYEKFPFEGPVDGAVAEFMAFCNRRLARLARRRTASGRYGRLNGGHRFLLPGFEPSPRVLARVAAGIAAWLRAEITDALTLPAPASRH